MKIIMSPEAPEFGGYTPDQIRQFEQWRQEGERRQLMPWEGERFVTEVEKHKRITEARDINFPEIEEDIMDGLAYQMGRLVERTGYYLEPEGLGVNEIYDLIGIFCTVEQGRKRPRTQITTAIENATLVNISRINEGEIVGWESIDILSLFGVDKSNEDAVERFGETENYQAYLKEVEKWETRTGKDEQEMTGEEHGEILKKITKLKLREVHRKFMARESIAKADLQRLLTADDGDGMVDMILRGKDPWWQDVETPDALAWQSAFAGEFGEKVDAVLREIERLGREGFEFTNLDNITERLDCPYAKLSEFSSEYQFAAWINELYEAADERMDIVLFAWQLARVWGITDELGYTKKREKKKVYDHSTDKLLGEKEVELHQIGDSPLVTDHSTWTMHTLAKLMSEYGLTALGQRDDVAPELAKKFPFLTAYRTTQDRHISHSGAPYHFHEKALAHLYQPYLKWSKVPVKIDSLTDAYCQENDIEKTEGTKNNLTKVPLYDLWRGDARGTETKLAELPWSSTAMTKVQADEPLPKASFGLWQLFKGRTNTVVKKMMRGVPALNDLLNAAWWEESQFRHVKKVASAKEGMDPVENPRVRLLYDWLLTRRPSYDIMNGVLDYHYKNPDETWVGSLADKSPTSIDIILNNAWNVGFIGPKDFKWIKNNLGGTMIIGQRKSPQDFYRK
jgi:hypothetical protein